MARFGTNHRGGRPRGSKSLLAEKMRTELTKTVHKEFKPIIRAQIDLAKGLVEERPVKLEDGSVAPRFYRARPLVESAKYLLDQAIGKAKESIEHSGSMTLVDFVKNTEERNAKERSGV